jgi:hypothetical protein
MRYYDLEIFTLANSESIPLAKYTSLIQGNTVNSYRGQTTNPNALNIEFDVGIAPSSDPTQNSYVRVHGIPLKDLTQASNFNGAQLRISGGMWKGLPLANYTQSGVLVAGIILQAFGNWQGTLQTIDFIVSSSSTYYGEQKNLVLEWRKDKKLADALQVCLQRAYPDAEIQINISDRLIASADLIEVVPNIRALANYIYRISKNIIKDVAYNGVAIVFPQTDPNKGNIRAYDNVAYSPPKPKQINFQDLIGQPTWIRFGTMTFKTVLRADLAVGDYITMPAQASLLQVTTPQSYSQDRQRSVFEGKFEIGNIRHVGNYRMKSADSWVTIIQASPR